MIILVCILGLMVGSFVNAVVWRVYKQSAVRSPQSKAHYSIMHGRSMCPNCKHQLAAIDLVPVLSWLLLRGKCRYCSKPISIQYPTVELITSLLFVVVYLVIGNPANAAAWLQLLLWLYILAVFMILSVYDLRWMLLPDVVLLPAIGVTCLTLVARYLAGMPLSELTSSFIAAAGAGVFFYALAVATRGKGMGGGDIKLVFLMGLLLGVEKTLFALFVAFCSGALIGVLLIVVAMAKKTNRPKYIPFGPFLMGGTLVAFAWGGQIIRWYMGMIVF